MPLKPNAVSNKASSTNSERVVSLWAVALFAVQSFLSFWLLGDLSGVSTQLPPGFSYFVLVVGLIGMAFAYALPTLKSQGMSQQWGVPKTTFLLSRPLLRFVCSGAVGSALGTLLALPFVGLQFFTLALSQVGSAYAIVIATRRRFRQHPGTEWTMPLPGYKILRPLQRGFRPDE